MNFLPEIIGKEGTFHYFNLGPYTVYQGCQLSGRHFHGNRYHIGLCPPFLSGVQSPDCQLSVPDSPGDSRNCFPGIPTREEKGAFHFLPKSFSENQLSAPTITWTTWPPIELVPILHSRLGRFRTCTKPFRLTPTVPHLSPTIGLCPNL